MFSIEAKTRKISGKKVKQIRQQGRAPAVLYGPKIKPLVLEVDLKDFTKVYSEAGESSMINLIIDKQAKENLVLIKQINRDPIEGKILHIDFFQPDLTEKITASVPLIFEGEPLAVKELGGTLVKNISELEVKGLPQTLPRVIRIDTSGLNTFEDEILVKDLKIAKDIEVLKAQEDVVASVLRPEKVEEELEKPIEEKVEDVEKAGEADKEEEKAEPKDEARVEEKAKKEDS